MQTFSVPRSGNSPLLFEGEQLCHVRGIDLWPKDKANPPHRWHEITIYRTQSGRYVVAIRFHCNPKYDDPYEEAEVCDTPQDVIEYLTTFDPVDGIRGWTLEKHREQDRRLRAALVANFETLVSQALSSRPEFAVRV